MKTGRENVEIAMEASINSASILSTFGESVGELFQRDLSPVVAPKKRSKTIDGERRFVEMNHGMAIRTKRPEIFDRIKFVVFADFGHRHEMMDVDVTRGS